MSAGRTCSRRCRSRRTPSRSARAEHREETMPHILVKLWPGESEPQKQSLAEEITKAVERTLGYGEEAVSVAFEEVEASEWTEKVYKPEILGKPQTIYKKPGYTPD